MLYGHDSPRPLLARPSITEPLLIEARPIATASWTCPGSFLCTFRPIAIDSRRYPHVLDPRQCESGRGWSFAPSSTRRNARPHAAHDCQIPAYRAVVPGLVVRRESASAGTRLVARSVVECIRPPSQHRVTVSPRVTSLCGVGDLIWRPSQPHLGVY